MHLRVILRAAGVVMAMAILALLVWPAVGGEIQAYVEYICSGKNKLDLVTGVAEHIAAAVGVWFLVAYVRAVFFFIKKSIYRTDKMFIGTWFIYRYTVSRGVPIFICDKWRIWRTISNKYVVSILPHGKSRRDNKASGVVICNERDRFSVLFVGRDHKEQSIVCFSPRISIDYDTRIFGLAVGDDADYTLSSRPYLASRTELDEMYAKDTIDDAVEALRSHIDTPLIQFSDSLMNQVFHRHPWQMNVRSGDTLDRDVMSQAVLRLKTLLNGSGWM